MLSETTKTFFSNNLGKLKQEIEAYRDEQKIWATEGSIANSAGNLCLHLVGSLNHFIGRELGGTGYTRNRDAEFSQKGVPRQELVKKIEETIVVVDNAMDSITASQLAQDYPLAMQDKKVTVEYVLLLMVTHVNYHLGQVNYHRRLLDK